MKQKWDNKNVLDYAVSTAKAEGIEQGIEKGIEKGEYSKALAIARELKNEGLDIAFIAKTTKLTVAQIEKL